MMLPRRHALQTLGGLGLYGALAAIGLLPATAAAEAFDVAAFKAKTLTDALRTLGIDAPTESGDVVITSAEIAENGAVVPVGVLSRIPKTEFIALLVEKNPQPLAGTYTLLEGVQPDVNMRIKMSQSSNVVAIVRAEGRYYMARKEIKVTIGGCGA